MHFGTMHVRGAKVDWWTSALDTVAAHAAGCTERCDEFPVVSAKVCCRCERDTIFAAAAPSAYGPAEMVNNGDDREFLDQQIISHDTFEHWHKI